MKKKIFRNTFERVDVPMEDDFLKQEKPVEWEINADVDPDKRRQAMEYLKNGYGTRKVSGYLGILVHQIVRKK